MDYLFGTQDFSIFVQSIRFAENETGVDRAEVPFDFLERHFFNEEPGMDWTNKGARFLHAVLKDFLQRRTQGSASQVSDPFCHRIISGN